VHEHHCRPAAVLVVGELDAGALDRRGSHFPAG
jgi:hypothetical protein